MSDTTYDLNQENGELSRKGEVIGTFNSETGELVIADAKFNNYRAAATRFINSLADEAEKTDETQPTPTPPTEETGTEATPETTSETPAEEKPSEETPAPSSNEASDEEKAAMEEESKTAIKEAQASNKSDKDFSASTGCPPPPKRNPMYGDKTPAYVEWLKEHRPDVFNAKYGVTGPGKVPIIDEETGETTGYRDATMATRKNHLTDKEASNEGLSEDESWDA